MLTRRSTIRSAALAPLVAALACLSAAPAEGHTLDVRNASHAVRVTAATLGQVESVDCSRPVTGKSRDRRHATCVARVNATPAGDCFVFYEVRMVHAPARLPRVFETFDPWCAGVK